MAHLVLQILLKIFINQLRQTYFWLKLVNKIKKMGKRILIPIHERSSEEMETEFPLAKGVIEVQI